MAKSKRWYLLCYDIREPKRLQKVARLLESFGHRLQYSIFRCHLTKRELERLNWELTRIVAEEDDVLTVGLCAHCTQNLGCRNPKHTWAVDEQPHFEII